MSSLKEVKTRITSVESTQQITKAMKMVSAAKLRKAQARVWQLRPYDNSLQAIVAGLLQRTDSENPLLTTSLNPKAPPLIIPISSDRGLCGTFNSSITKATLQQVVTLQQIAKQSEVCLLPLGKRVYAYFRSRHKPLISNFYEIFHNFHYTKVCEIAQYLIQQYLEGRASRILLIYNEAKNIATQLLRVRTFLPFEKEEMPTQTTSSANYIYEPSESEVLDTLLPLCLQTKLYRVLAESNAAEHGARMTAMGKASENADQLLKELRVSYNRTRQAVITGEILEIMGGANALKDS